jgi:hypothetical protein
MADVKEDKNDDIKLEVNRRNLKEQIVKLSGNKDKKIINFLEDISCIEIFRKKHRNNEINYKFKLFKSDNNENDLIKKIYLYLVFYESYLMENKRLIKLDKNVSETKFNFSGKLRLIKGKLGLIRSRKIEVEIKFPEIGKYFEDIMDFSYDLHYYFFRFLKDSKRTIQFLSNEKYFINSVINLYRDYELFDQFIVLIGYYFLDKNKINENNYHVFNFLKLLIKAFEDRECVSIKDEYFFYYIFFHKLLIYYARTDEQYDYALNEFIRLFTLKKDKAILKYSEPEKELRELWKNRSLNVNVVAFLNKKGKFFINEITSFLSSKYSFWSKLFF